MSSGVYQIRNLLNDKRYVGSSRDIPARWGHHRRVLRAGKHRSVHLQRAWDYYGEGNFVFEILEHAPASENTTREQVYMDLFQVCDPSRGYNTAKRAGSNLGNRMSDEARRKISEGQKGRVFSAEHRARIGAAHKGRKASTATRAKISDAAKKRIPRTGTPCSPETRAKISAALSGEGHPQFGVPLSEETRRKIGESNLGKHSTKGRKHSPETRENIRKSKMGQVISDETKAKIGNANRGRKHTEEAKATMREGHRSRREG